MAAPDDADGRADWVWLSLAPLGLGSWAPLYAGIRAEARRWVWLGLLWSAITVAGWALASIGDGGSGAGLLIVLGWTGGVATSFAIRSEYRRRMASPLERAARSVEEQIEDQDRAREIVREEPLVARRLGIGRPDLPGAQDCGLVDANNASAGAIETLPGTSRELADRIVEARGAAGFASVEDMGAALDLDANLVEELRQHVIFLPRKGV
jgi:hypothetical protein